MGKFIYLMDAYEDYESDVEKNCVQSIGTLWIRKRQQDLDTWCRLILTSMMSECAKVF